MNLLAACQTRAWISTIMAILPQMFAAPVEPLNAIATFPGFFWGVARVAVPHLRRIFTSCPKHRAISRHALASDFWLFAAFFENRGLAPRGW